MEKNDINDWCVGDVNGDNNTIVNQSGIIIGPEGGFSDKEIDKLKNLHKIKLNENILRTETAGIAGLCFINNMKNL